MMSPSGRPFLNVKDVPKKNLLLALKYVRLRLISNKETLMTLLTDLGKYKPGHRMPFRLR